MNALPKLALVGAGFFARFQAEAWRRIDGVTLAAVADSQPGKARTFAEQHGIPRAYESVTEMLDAEKPDIVDIATRPESHLALVTEAARRGVHVICQKPMAPTLEDGEAMCDVCDRHGVRLLIHENWRWQPWYRHIKNLLNASSIGTPVQAAFFWRTGDGRGPEPYAHQPYFRQMPRLLVYEALVHILDTLRFLLGEVRAVHCQLNRINPAIAGEDQALITLKFESGAHGLIDANRVSGPFPPPVAMGHLILEGDQGTLRMNGDGQVFLTRWGQSEQSLPIEPQLEGYKGDSVRATQAHLLECLRTGTPAESEGRDYLNTVRLVEACYESSIANQTGSGTISP